MKKEHRQKNTSIKCPVASIYSAGFTFIEMLVAVSILLVAVVGPMTLSSQGLRAARVSRDQISANYLAQEAIEYLRYRRDTNVLSGQDWMNGFTECQNAWCTFDVYLLGDGGTVEACSESEVCPIWFHEDTGRYEYPNGSQVGWVESKFTRRIFIDTVNYPSDEVAVMVTVRWQDGLINRAYSVTEHLFNWQE